MDRHIIDGANQEEAIGAHAGFRIRVVTTWDVTSRQFVVMAFVRGSETEDEVPLTMQKQHFPLLQDAQDQGFAVATAWIDQQAKR